MNAAMLWYDDDKRRTFDDKVIRACKYYSDKYGNTPTLCYVNPQHVPEGQRRVGGMIVKTAKTVLPDHFWIGQLGNKP